MVQKQLTNAIHRLCGTVLLPLAVLSFPMLAHAADTTGPEPEYTIAYNVGVVSDYRVRGIAQTSKDPAIQGGVDFAHKNGLYLGLAASNVKWVKDFNGATKGDLEVDLYGGYKGQVNSDLSYDLGAIRYQYPGNNSGAVGTPGAGLYSNASTTELYGAVTYKIVTFKYNRSVGDFLGNLNSSGSQYFDLSAGFDLTNGYTLTPHIGRQTIPHQGGQGDYNDVALTLAKDFTNGLVATISAQATDAKKGFYTDFKGKFLGKSVLLAGVKYTF